MSGPTIQVKVGTRGLAATTAEVQALRTGLSDRRGLHARLAGVASEFTRDYLRGLKRHKTARALGAKPTEHLARAARGVEAASNDQAAIVRVPRSSGLGRAFGPIEIRPKAGRKFLTIPADKRTYGKRAGEFRPGELVFTIVGGRYPALMFRDGWTVAYWLRRVVRQDQDRTLLPSDAAYRKLTRGVAAAYIDELLAGAQEGGPA